ncbi:uncharacterized protein LOC132607843 [Lycium barbarum]|uniref:uncharacterized protein LOC132607843 n=1 Tax=Lycium barbarum TaxID=112863 RepID=UPI00293E1B1F|nr:uncharacterized protein LOC132607843 [Lycium barbarum]
MSGLYDSSNVSDPPPIAELSPPDQSIALQKGEALSYPGWRQAMMTRCLLTASGTWELVPLFSDHSVFYRHFAPAQCIYLVVFVDSIVITSNDQDGIEIAQSRSVLQCKYASDILEETVMMGCRPTDTPMDPNAKLLPRQGEPLSDLGRYRPWLLDPGKGLLSEDRGHEQIVGYTNADWAGSPSMDVLHLDIVFYCSEKLNFGEINQIELVCDNKEALHVASNLVFHERTKIIEIDCHFVREKILFGDIVTKFMKSSDHLVDTFTKSLTGPRISHICKELGRYDL